MMYTLITKDGRVLVFNLEGCARLYQRAYGGQLITDDILNDTTQQTLAAQ